MTGLALVARALEIVFWIALHTARFLGRLFWAWATGRPTDPLAGRFATELLESLGTTFVKAGQVLSARPDLLPAAWVRELRRLQDEIAPPDTRRVLERVEAALGRPLGEVFDSFDAVPVSAASVAVVHRARLLDGRDVAVKVRRPGVARKVRDDLRLLRAVVSVLVRLPRLRTLPLREVVDEVGRAIEMQLDLDAEAENNRVFRRNFAHVERVRIPALVDELCSKSVLVMEYLPDLAKVDEPSAISREDREKGAVTGLRALYKMIFLDGLVHADMHPGNVFIRCWGEFVMLDLGLVARLDAEHQRRFADFFLGMVTNDGERCSAVVHDTALALAPDFDRARFDREMVRLVDHHSGRDARDFEVTRFAVDLFETQRRCGVVGSAAFTMVILSLVVYEGIVKLLHPTLDFQGEARGFLIAARSRAR